MARRCRHPMFKGRHFDQEIIILCVRWHATYKLSYRDLAAMMLERGISVTPSTIFRWVQRYVPEFEKRWDRFSRPIDYSWRVDETYILVKGEWSYLYRAVDKQGRTVDFLLRQDRGIAAAQAFFRKAFASHPNRPPQKVALDSHWPSHRALRLLRREHPAWRRVHVRTRQYLRRCRPHPNQDPRDGPSPEQANLERSPTIHRWQSRFPCFGLEIP